MSFIRAGQLKKQSKLVRKKSPKQKEGFQPRPYQKKAIKFMIERGAAGLFLDPGLGKTAVTLHAYEILKMRNLVDTMFIVAPKRPVFRVWPKELIKWGLDKSFSYTILHGRNKDALLGSDSDIYITNYESLPWLYSRLKMKRFRSRFGTMMLVLDESSKVRNSRTKTRFKVLKEMLDWFNRRYILTGTPAPKGYIGLWSQIYVLDQGHALERYITHFKNKYFYKTGFGGYDLELMEGAEKKILKKLKPYVLSLGRELLKMPPLVNVTVDVELDAKAYKVYEGMEKELITMIDHNEITAANAAVATGKCSQIANGAIYLGEKKKGVKRRVKIVHDEKIEALLDIIDELQGQPVLIAYRFKHDLDRLLKALPKNTPYFGSGVSSKNEIKIEEAWNRGETPILLGQIESVAHGLNLQESGSNIIWFSLTWNLEDYEQYYQRLWRSGQKNTVMNYHIVAKDTVDETIMRVLSGKSKTQRELLNALKSDLERKRK